MNATRRVAAVMGAALTMSTLWPTAVSADPTYQVWVQHSGFGENLVIDARAEVLSIDMWQWNDGNVWPHVGWAIQDYGRLEPGRQCRRYNRTIITCWTEWAQDWSGWVYVYGSDGADQVDMGLSAPFGDVEMTMWGRAGDDVLLGGSGDDKLFGEEGDDRLVGEQGINGLHGGDGTDTCRDAARGSTGCEL